jgi:hypothetical protein
MSSKIKCYICGKESFNGIETTSGYLCNECEFKIKKGVFRLGGTEPTFVISIINKVFADNFFKENPEVNTKNISIGQIVNIVYNKYGDFIGTYSEIKEKIKEIIITKSIGGE